MSAGPMVHVVTSIVEFGDQGVRLHRQDAEGSSWLLTAKVAAAGPMGSNEVRGVRPGYELAQATARELLPIMLQIKTLDHQRAKLVVELRSVMDRRPELAATVAAHPDDDEPPF